MRACALTGESEIRSEALEMLIETLNAESAGASFMEIGTAAGGTLCRLLNDWKLARYSQAADKSWVVDPMNYFPDQRQIVETNIKDRGIDPGIVTFFQMTSAEAYKNKFQDVEPLDFLLIDGSHKVKYVAQDARWISKVKNNGLIAFDDFGCGFDGVDWVVNYFRKKENSHYQEIFCFDGLIVFRKKQALGSSCFPLSRVLFAHILHPIFQLIASCRKRL